MTFLVAKTCRLPVRSTGTFPGDLRFCFGFFCENIKCRNELMDLVVTIDCIQTYTKLVCIVDYAFSQFICVRMLV